MTQTRWLALPVILAGVFMTILDFSIVNVAIPSIQQDLHAGAAEIQFVVAGYSLTYGCGLIIGGRLGDRFGRRRMYTIGLALFTVASVVCGLAPTALVLVIARLVQGAGSAVLFPQVLSLLNVSYSGEDRARAFRIYGLVLGLATACGQLVGGLLIRAGIFGLDWRSCFLINIPFGVAAVALAGRWVTESRSTAKGASLGTVALVLVRSRTFLIGVGTVLATYAGMASFFLVLAVFLQDDRGYTALESGLAFLPVGVAFMVTSLFGARLSKLLGRNSISIGGVILAASELLLAAMAEASGWALVLPLALVGCGMGIVMTPLISRVLSEVDPEHAGSASGVLSTMQQLGNSLGVALIGAIFYGAHAHAFPFAMGYTAFMALVVAFLATQVTLRDASRWPAKLFRVRA